MVRKFSSWTRSCLQALARVKTVGEDGCALYGEELKDYKDALGSLALYRKHGIENGNYYLGLRA